jgi:hypothetical protein
MRIAAAWRRFHRWVTQFRSFRRWAPPPPAPPPAPSDLLTISMITREALKLQHLNDEFLATVERQYRDAGFGSQLRIRLPDPPEATP